jgi:hypothetical protein
MKQWTWAILMFLLLTALTAFPAESPDTERKMERAIYLVDRIGVYLEAPDLARLGFLRAKLTQVLDYVKRGEGNTFESLHYFHEMILTFRYSSSYFKQVETELTRDEIRELAELTEGVAKERKFDEFVHTHITESVLAQMHKLVRQLLDSHGLPQELADKLTELSSPLGFALAEAKNGDRPDTFDRATPVARRIEALYGEFYSVGRSHSAWDVLMEIQGLNDFYLEFAKRS